MAKINHHALIDAGLVLRILKLAQGSMPICAAAAANLCFTILILRVRPLASTRALILMATILMTTGRRSALRAAAADVFWNRV